MAHTQTTMQNALLDNVRGNNTLVNDLARRRMYDIAVDEFQAKDRRPKINFSKAISEEQTLIATDNYPEFQITFYNTQNAVHSLAGGLRALELEYLMMQVPYGSTTFDIGGNFAAHLFKGRDYVHCCMPNLDCRDIMRHENQKDSVDMYLQRLKKSGKVIPHFQKPAFDRYCETPADVVCHDTFQSCSYDVSRNGAGRNYAIALHSIYDIPADDFGAALMRKNVHTCYAAFHFSEELLLENTHVSLEEIGAMFTREGDSLSFCFVNESTLNYSHSYSNLLRYVCKTYFPASSTVVYMKEFLVTRVNTWFCKFTQVDTCFLHRGVHLRGADREAFYAGMEDAWHYKKTLALINSERVMLNDAASINFWFPKMKDKVIIPLFDISIDTYKRSRKEVLIDKDFVYTVLNHIRTYQAKALTYANVLSFVESIRSRVIINGVTARAEWNVDKALLQSLSMTFFLQTKLAMLKDDLMISKFKVGAKTLSEHVWDEVRATLGNVFPSVKEGLIRRKLISVSANALEIKVPDLYTTFQDRFVSEYNSLVEMPTMNIVKQIEDAEQMYNAMSELSVLENSDKFDVTIFSEMCKNLEVDPYTAAKVIVAVLQNESGVTLTFSKPTEINVATALAASEVEGEEIVLSSKPAEYVSTRSMVAEGKLPMEGLIGDCSSSSMHLNPEIESLSQFHCASVDSLIKKQMASIVYTGPLKVQQMKNYMDSLSASLSASVSNLKKIIRDTVTVDSEPGKFGVWDVSKRSWIVKPASKGHAWGVVELHNGKLKLMLLEYSGAEMICEASWRRVAVSTDSMVYSDMKKLQTLRGCLKDGEPHVSSAKVTLVDGVPGCGKTKEILQRVDLETDLILVPGKQAAAMIRKRANAKGLIVATTENVKTVDSFLMNLGKKPLGRVENLFIDEGLMLHPGCVNFLVSLTMCDRAFVFGDTQQIPYINRVQNFPYPKHFATLEVDEVETRRVTMRCPADVTHFLNERYSGTVMCSSGVQKSVSSEILVGAGSVNPITKPLKGKILTFTQSDKFALTERGYEDVNTVHEVQGETYEDVSVVRLTPTPLALISRDSPHVLVCLSRHTKSFKYYTVVLDPLVSLVRDLEKVSHYLLDMYKVSAGQQ
ncbi:replicase [Brugmansia mild mottle virus]|uniref:125 kDa replicase n=2 Tax=Brugmansia mild mottle virus TaxID=402399 RepID=Q0E5F4_9VIRU|nr:replicase [Brugmansia mild mottle virus]CAL39164.1 125 kDa replicase [Brugmansia mild mottle virus]